MSVIWHDLECGSYSADLDVWRKLAAECGDPVLEIGAGTGRVALSLARDGNRVFALERDEELLGALSERAVGLAVETKLADARDFELEQQFPLCVVPMQTIQLLGGVEGRAAFLRCAARHLQPRGILAVAVSEQLDIYEVHDGAAAPLPDIAEIDGVVYASQPTAVRARPGQFVLVRRREEVRADGERSISEDLIALDRLAPSQLEREAGALGFERARRLQIPPTPDYVGSTVVVLRA